ncbi:MAG: hypothetical protein V4689_14230 [Verrucomicrobiota bacterium]
MISTLILILASAYCWAEGVPGQEAGNPATGWIWKSKTPADGEKVFFRREFELPPNVASATISIVCDDWQHLYVNGVDLGMVGGWTTLKVHDVLPHLKQGGRNVITVEGRNNQGHAALALRFRATLKDGKKLHVVTDGTWVCSTEAPDGWRNLDFPTESWPKAVVVAKMGDAPWGLVMPVEVEQSPGAAELTDTPPPAAK